MWRDSKPQAPIIRHEQYHVAQYLDVAHLSTVSFDAPDNTKATQTVDASLRAKNVRIDIQLEGSARADRLKTAPGSKVLEMAYFYAQVLRNPTKYANDTVDDLNDWADALCGPAKEVMDEVRELLDELNQGQHAVHAVVRPIAGATYLLQVADLEPWYLVASVIARRVGYQRARTSHLNGTELRERVLRPLVWLGFWIVLVLQCVFVVLSLQATRSKLAERLSANRRDYKDWFEGNVMAYGGHTQWMMGYAYYNPGSHIDTIQWNSRIETIAEGLLCLGCVVVTDYHDMSKNPYALYNEFSALFFVVGPAAQAAVAKLSGVKYDAAGGRVSSSAFALVLVWGYIVAVATAAILVCTENWGGRDAYFERVSDAVWVATTGLVSVFGLVKLTSEDPNAIRHALTGRTVLTTARDIFLHLDPAILPVATTWEEYLKICAASLPVSIEWAKDEQTCYLIEQVDGNIRIAEGIRSGALGKALIFMDEQAYFRCTVTSERPFKVEHVDGDLYHLSGERANQRPTSVKGSAVLR